METKDVFVQSGRLGERIKELGQEMDNLNQSCQRLMDLCPHEIVFKYIDNHPRMLFVDGNYFCPACSKTIKLISKDQFRESAFKKSRVIPLTNLSLLGTNYIYSLIRKEVYNNMDLYYSKESSIEDLSSKMEGILEEEQYDFTPPYLLLKK